MSNLLENALLNAGVSKPGTKLFEPKPLRFPVAESVINETWLNVNEGILSGVGRFLSPYEFLSHTYPVETPQSITDDIPLKDRAEQIWDWIQSDSRALAILTKPSVRLLTSVSFYNEESSAHKVVTGNKLHTQTTWTMDLNNNLTWYVGTLWHIRTMLTNRRNSPIDEKRAIFLSRY